MAGKPLALGFTGKTVEELRSLVLEHGYKEASRLVGCSHKSTRDRLRRAGRELTDQERAEMHRRVRGFEIPALPDKDRPVDEVIEARKREFDRNRDAEESRRVIPVKVKLKGPIGINLHGDPHLDDPGCDIGAIEHDCAVIRKTEGMFGVCAGDLTNNWVGRLARLYAMATTTAREAWKLVEWYAKATGGKWLFWIEGNHDIWQNGDLLRWIASRAGVLTDAHQVRIELRFPGGQKVRLAGRHDWPGRSMWNPTHGQLRAGKITVHDHVIFSGHRHGGGYQMAYVEASDLISHFIQLGSYKIYDDFRNERGFNRDQISPSVTLVIRPDAPSQAGLISVFHDTDTAADFLTYLRRRK